MTKAKVRGRNEANEIWRRLVNLTIDTRDGWRRAIAQATGLPHGRVRVLRRLVDGPQTLSELADALQSDAPATTVAVNELEERRLVSREPHPTNRRKKLVSLTAAGRAIVAKVSLVIEEAPPAFSSASPDDLAALARVLDAVISTSSPPAFSVSKRGK